MDNTFWALIALVLFFVLVAYFKVPGMITKALDARAARIRADLDEARSLKEEAKAQLAEYQRRRKDADESDRDGTPRQSGCANVHQKSLPWRQARVGPTRGPTPCATPSR